MVCGWSRSSVGKERDPCVEAKSLLLESGLAILFLHGMATKKSEASQKTVDLLVDLRPQLHLVTSCVGSDCKNDIVDTSGGSKLSQKGGCALP